MSFSFKAFLEEYQHSLDQYKDFDPDDLFPEANSIPFIYSNKNKKLWTQKGLHTHGDMMRRVGRAAEIYPEDQLDDLSERQQRMRYFLMSHALLGRVANPADAQYKVCSFWNNERSQYTNFIPCLQELRAKKIIHGGTVIVTPIHRPKFLEDVLEGGVAKPSSRSFWGPEIMSKAHAVGGPLKKAILGTPPPRNRKGLSPGEKWWSMYGEVKGYHGSEKDFDKFDPALLGKSKRTTISKLGFFFAPNPKEANVYADLAQRGGGIVSQWELNIKNPYKMSYEEFDTLINWGSLSQKYDSPEDAEKATLEKRQQLEQEGHDGVYIYNQDGKLSEIVAFHPNQMKKLDTQSSVNIWER